MSDEQIVKDLRSWAGYPNHASARSQCMVDAADAIERLEAELAREEEESEHYVRVAFVDPGANPPIAWKDRAEKAERELAEARAREDEYRDAWKEARGSLPPDRDLNKPWSQCIAIMDEALAAPAPAPDQSPPGISEAVRIAQIGASTGKPTTKRESPMDELQRLGQEYDNDTTEREAERRVVVTDQMIEAGKAAIDDYFDGTKDAPFEGSVEACFKAMWAAQQQALESDDAQ